ncbi:PhzF family phenazine biosynthesis protein [Vibrio cholerae]|nr:PhzF family phenazine biosynthesis protein [Vibrio cholerae]EJH4017327.1 PhzF family phenazine biosynthesis protein [Vibrio cholerae]EKF9092901.1 PhzF family phenazine biosynthesis protein [Vibrio cholerae]EKF9470656.1 PhzF family phenazine biosynthesis protein [Vibrio cholerae]ELF5302017.1 PhzF family phenazine biosynthesis protein [Vibrio cholerae]
MKCKLVDVFTRKKLSGNGLTIFYDYKFLNKDEMLSLTQEMRQFESIFVCASDNNESHRAKIFTIEEELDFAGHPIIGLAAHLHDESGKKDQQEWTIELNNKLVKVKTKKTDTYYHASMNQGNAEFIYTLNNEDVKEIILSLNLSIENLSIYPMEVVSTGLPYLIVPITSGIEKAKISIMDFEILLAKFGAKFVYVFDLTTFEGRTWDNGGLIEDIATGSAAGPTAAYLTKHKLAPYDSTIIISQGRFLGRASEIQAYVETKENTVPSIWVSGDVVKVANIEFV